MTVNVGLGMLNGLRLTLTSNTPVTTSDVTGATTIYLTPYKHGRIALYDGVDWSTRTSSEVSLALGTLTSNIQYDVFAYWNGSAVRLELSSSWATYVDHAGMLLRKDGVLVKAGDPTRRYVGTIRTTSTTQTEDSSSKRYVWNMYNQLPRHLSVIDNTNTWTYVNPNSVWRQVRAASTNAFDVVIGGAISLGDYGSHLSVTATGLVFASAAAVGNEAAVGIGVNVTSFLPSTCKIFGCNPNSTTLFMPCTAEYRDFPNFVWGEGHHTINWLETGVGGAVTYTFAGDNGTTVAQTGMVGWLIA